MRKPKGYAVERPGDIVQVDTVEVAMPGWSRPLKQFTARDIVSECTLAQSTVWEHLRILREAGVLGTRKDGSRISYSLRHTVLVEFSAAVVELSGSVLVAT